jgi:membrane protein implicated in regulation of membrane protease activity
MWKPQAIAERLLIGLIIGAGYCVFVVGIVALITGNARQPWLFPLIGVVILVAVCVAVAGKGSREPVRRDRRTE